MCGNLLQGILGRPGSNGVGRWKVDIKVIDFWFCLFSFLALSFSLCFLKPMGFILSLSFFTPEVISFKGFCLALSIPVFDPMVVISIPGSHQAVNSVCYIYVKGINESFSYLVESVGGEIQVDFKVGVSHDEEWKIMGMKVV
jgi:hypothetical protein